MYLILMYRCGHAGEQHITHLKPDRLPSGLSSLASVLGMVHTSALREPRPKLCPG